ncbi:NAD(P)/FAD-dependent oxidoreductase [Rhizobium sp. CFBP 8752]|uniref:NAD(P)/FAD-dependent oxidoreductase n=1 Tax=Rhizobium sp. CFBP 8752 TaxID=2775301 RepID=UPI00177DD29C|nr:NAD(P)/FAD-dependent oxidoreductase [Rhizobium sp. CFBP 8752]MBD8662011.1 NAD(P)/FAD-dependent oxidoreductase [Rhizobium sp. CFBP 8752]
MSDTIYDVIIIGGSYAGLSAALQLGRARRKVLMIDEGLRRNRFASHSHGFLTQDRVNPAEIAAEARSQVMEYPTVDWVSGRADTVQHNGEKGSGAAHVTVLVRDTRYRSRRLILALGVRDILPDIEGLKERWGKSVFHCPYCHGYELNQGKIGVIAGSALSMHHALMLPDWGPTTLLLNQAFEPDRDQLQSLAARGVVIERSPVKALTDHADVQLVDGRTLSFSGLFALAPFEVSTSIAQQLGLDMEQGPLGATIKTDAMKETSLPGVFACGDAARPMASVALAVGDGSLAGVAVHRSLLFATINDE